MAVKAYVIRNSVDGKYDTFHWDPTAPSALGPTHDAVNGNRGTGNGQVNTNRDSTRSTGEGR